MKPFQLGALFGARAIIATEGDFQAGLDWAKTHGYPEVASAMRSDRHDAGGSWVPENLVSDFIELLTPASAVRKLNPLIIPMEGSASFRKVTGGATAYYKGEAQRGTKSEASSGRVNLVAKELMVFVPVSNQLLRSGAMQLIQDDSISSIARREDIAFIRGDGTEHTPKGLRYRTLAANLVAANATVNLANVTEDLGKLILALEGADVQMRRPGWIFAPRTKRYLMDVRDSNGNFAFRAEMLTGKLSGAPFATTSQVPVNLGTGSDESEVYFADFADVAIGELPAIRVDAMSQATYWDGSEWVSCAQNDESVVRVIAEHDIGMRHDESVAVLTGVKWGA